VVVVVFGQCDQFYGVVLAFKKVFNVDISHFFVCLRDVMTLCLVFTSTIRANNWLIQ
jgi:hypothetical protein